VITFSNMKVISFITEHTESSLNLEQSLKRYGYSYEFIGIGEKWEGFISTKIYGCYQHLLKQPDGIYVILDGYDMLAVHYPHILLHRYEKFKTPIVFGGEKFGFSYNSQPIRKYSLESFWNSRKYLNGGFCIGDRESLLKMYLWIIRHDNCGDDQMMACIYANLYPKLVSVDISSQLVFNTITSIDSKNYQLFGKRMLIRSTNTYPCFIHFPAVSSDGYERYNEYGKAILDSEFIPQVGEKSWNYFANQTLYNSCIFILCILVFILYGRNGLLALLGIGISVFRKFVG
jgi:hypothetical protein